ncbi:MAG TPA: M28 family peptidase [Actinomycetota bacterium]|nr:M28 family peptidase [Actinomycetota bacterium]
MTKRSTLRRALAPLAAVAVVASLLAPQAAADERANTQGLRKAVTLAGVRDHQAALQAIADANGDTRLSGTSGFDASAEYVIDKAEAAGYDVSVFEFEFLLVGDRTPPEMERVAPNPRTYVNGQEFLTMNYSGSGDSTAPLTAVDVAGGTSGCEPADFAGFPAGDIALIKRGTCTFRVKADNAVAAGASAAIIYNDGLAPDRMGVINGRLNPPETLVAIPTVGTSFAIGQELANGVVNGATGVTMRVRVDSIAETRTTRNVIAETPGGDPDHVVVVGAHLDSVSRGPGINDNGSGSAAILELAEQLSARDIEPRNKLRFMWYGAEEHGLIGSTRYVQALPQAERDKIELMLNFDMIGSPNFVRFVYDGDNSAFPVGPGVAAGPPGSGEIEQTFRDYFASQGLPVEPTPFNGRSDYGPFIAAGIPAGGLFTGAEGIKTPAQAAVYGGTAGAQFDPCYHLACDTYDNNSDTALDQMSDAIAHTVLVYAKRNFVQRPLTDPAPAADAGAGGGGGLHDDHDDHARVSM